VRRLFIACLLASFTLCASAETLRVVSSIKPVQLLVTAIGGEAVDSQLLLPAGFSPHDARLKPSQWQMINKAELLIWVGPALERFLESALAGNDKALMLQTGAGQDLSDPHIWMNVARVAQMSVALSERLSSLRPQHKALFEGNAARLRAALQMQHGELLQALALKKLVYLLPHRGYSHFERQYGLAPAAVLSLNDEQMPGTAHIVELRSRLLAGEFGCVFREPQQSSRLISRLLSGVDVRVIPLDPMGASVANDRQGFEQYYRALGEAFVACQQPG
jgi:zinc transport system substrate-binding protein